MADAIPVKAIFTGSDTTALGEYIPTDTVPLAHLPSISTQGGATTTDLNNHIAAVNPHSVTPAQIGAVASSEKGVANGVATLDAGGLVPSSQIPAIAIPSMHVVADTAARLALTVQEGDEAKQLDDGSHWIYDGTTWHMYPSAGTPIYGSEFQKLEVPGVQETNYGSSTNNFQTAGTLTTTSLPAGTYHITWSYGWSHNSTSADFESEFRLDSSILVENHRQEPKDSSGGTTQSPDTHTDQKFYMFREAFTALSGIHTIDLRFRSTSNEDTWISSVWDLIITVKRVT